MSIVMKGLSVLYLMPALNKVLPRLLTNLYIMFICKILIAAEFQVVKLTLQLGRLYFFFLVLCCVIFLAHGSIKLDNTQLCFWNCSTTRFSGTI